MKQKKGTSVTPFKISENLGFKKIPIYVSTDALGSQMGVSDPLKLKLEEVVSPHVYQIQVFC